MERNDLASYRRYKESDVAGAKTNNPHTVVRVIEI